MRTRSGAETRFLRETGFLALVVTLLLLVAALAHAGADSAPDETFTLVRAVVGAGGPPASGGGFELDATGGQPVAGPAQSAEAGLTAGFWGAPPAALSGHIYLPLTLR
jgi:hypothetical protein